MIEKREGNDVVVSTKGGDGAIERDTGEDLYKGLWMIGK